MFINFDLRNYTAMTMLIISLALLTSCVTAGEGVVNGVSTIYIPTKKDILTVSGNVASHVECGDFKIDNPIRLNITYHLIENEESDSTLIFGDNVKSAYAVIKCDDSTYSYSVKKYGGSKKASTVIGVYWGED